MKYVYPAIFTEAEEGGYIVTFPNKFPHVDGVTEGNTILEAYEMAEDLLNCIVLSVEEARDEMPESIFIREE